jgi:hypothetical protein
VRPGRFGPSAPKRRQERGSGGGDKVERKNEGKGSLVVVWKSVKLIQGYRLDGEGEKGKLTQAVF